MINLLLLFLFLIQSVPDSSNGKFFVAASELNNETLTNSNVSNNTCECFDTHLNNSDT